MFCIRLRHCVAIMTSFGVCVMTIFGYSLNPPPPIMPRTSTTEVSCWVLHSSPPNDRLHTRYHHRRPPVTTHKTEKQRVTFCFYPAFYKFLELFPLSVFNSLFSVINQKIISFKYRNDRPIFQNHWISKYIFRVFLQLFFLMN